MTSTSPKKMALAASVLTDDWQSLQDITIKSERPMTHVRDDLTALYEEGRAERRYQRHGSARIVYFRRPQQ
jgi:hypothetical protein